MLVVATENFELYYGLVDALRERDIHFTTIQPGNPIPQGTTALLVGSDDVIDAPEDIPVIVAQVDHERRAVEAALARLRGGRGRTIVGVDPGDRPGIAILDGGLVVAAFHVPLEEAVAVIREETTGEPDALVRIGDGARLKGAQIINELDDISIELVDETGTTPYLGMGARGVGDVLAAVNIAQLPGTPVSDRTIEPSAGELAVIKDRSRELSPTNREIDDSLAVAVAKGELTLEEALARHREE